MSARNCLLCGKPLGRIRIGAGDFCSREHQNQYRMRRGMDRLLEANEVATVLRRRETPKFVSSLVPSPETEPRMLVSAPLRFPVDESTVVVPSSTWNPVVEVPRSRGPIPRKPQDLPAHRRDFAMLRGTSVRVVPGFHAPRVEPLRTAYLNRARRPKTMLVAPMLGARLRVSTAAGFRLPKISTECLKTSAPRYAELIYPNRTAAAELRKIDQAAVVRQQGLRFPKRASSYPRGRKPVAESKLKLPGVVQLGVPGPCGNGAPASRIWGTMWTYPEDLMMPPVPVRGAGWDSHDFVDLGQVGLSGRDLSRMALVRLTPQEGTYTYAPAAAGAEKRRAASSNGGINEQFDAGLRNWVGGVADWQANAAGIRTGSLALFKPSLEMGDYELEFLARIENRSVTWVFRASGVKDYFSATIAAGPGGSLEFTRHAVIAGSPEPAVTARTRTSSNSRTFTVRQRAAGSTFAVWLDGEHIDTWIDSRLPSGGIGFIGSPQDRARIYWVKVSPAEPDKEYSA